ncbi:MAG TPA: alkane 1-monooxygenase [Polyangiales bacterium]|nr:alkane 1-monooxygenase [Polyangiales bacterium]
MRTVSGIAPRSVSSLRTSALHLWAFALPLITLVFWLTGPHAWWASLLWILPIVALVIVDNNAPADRRQPPADLPAWPFDLQVYALFALQVLNHVLLGVVTSKLSVATWPNVLQTAAMILPATILAGTNAGYSGIVVAHELVHRRNPIEYLMGRILLMGVLYEHFATEHVRGHHPRVGTPEDPATARFGETHREFVRRTIPAQFKSAWRLEKIRLGDANLASFSPRMLRHRVLQGVIAQVLIVAAFAYFFGWIAAVFFVLQARTAVMLLETVNYIEHWGLTRAGKKVVSVDSWDTDNWFTLYTLVGLSRHADHHAQAARPYQKLRHFEDTPKMPLGYYGTILLALFRNDRYQALAKAELQRKHLGPFRSSESAAPTSHVHPSLRAIAPTGI